MKLLLLLLFVALVSGQETAKPQMASENNEIQKEQATLMKAQPNDEEAKGDRNLSKRSYFLDPWSYGGGHGYAWPWYGWGGYGLYGGWYPSWPWYGSYYGWRGYGGWYKGW